MKATRLGLVFAMVFLCLMIPDYQKTMETKAMAKLQADYNRALDQAALDAVSGLVEKDDGRQVWLNKDEAVKQFFVSLAVNFDKMESYGDRKLLYQYVPAVLVIEKEKFYIGWELEKPKWQEYSFSEKYGDFQVFYTLGDFVIIENLTTGEKEEGDYHDLKEKYSFPFFEEEPAFEAERRKIIIGLLTECFDEKIKEHNRIAEKYGIAYEFTLPVIELEEWYRTIDDIGFVALFQGYPYGSGYTGYYNRVALGGARLYTKEE